MSSKSSNIDDFESWDRLSNVSSTPSSNSINLVQWNVNNDRILNDFVCLSDLRFESGTKSPDFDTKSKFAAVLDKFVSGNGSSKTGNSDAKCVKKSTKRPSGNTPLVLVTDKKFIQDLETEDWSSRPQLMPPQNWDLDSEKNDFDFDEIENDDKKRIVPKSFWWNIHLFTLTNFISFLIGCGLGVLLNRHGHIFRLLKFS